MGPPTLYSRNRHFTHWKLQDAFRLGEVVAPEGEEANVTVAQTSWRETEPSPGPGIAPAAPAVDLYWIPLGAGSPIVQASGRLYETISARRHRRRRCDLYHAALQVTVPQGRYTIEQAPVPDDHGEARGVVAVGPVGIRAAGRLRVFCYEVRCWRDGTIPDIAEAVDSPVRLTTDDAIASGVLEVLPSVPTPVWGRDMAATGDMWNSNSVIAWVLTRSGIDMDPIQPPPGGRAPGWNAGRIVAAADTSEPTGLTDSVR